jgi:hypothetical protein
MIYKREQSTIFALDFLRRKSNFLLKGREFDPEAAAGVHGMRRLAAALAQ